MKARFVWITFGLAFSVTLAVIVGQRLTAEAMAVMVGVVAGVSASIPTSLIVVWFATRTASLRPAGETPRMMERLEPRLMVMPQPPSPVNYPTFAGYPAQAYPGYSGPNPNYMAQPTLALAPREFAIIGGANMGFDDQAVPAEVVWQP